MRLPEDYSGATSDDHLVGLWLSGRPETTQRVYRIDANHFLAYLDEKGLQIQEATAADLLAWAEGLDGKPASRARRVSSIKSLLSFAWRTGYTVFNVGKVLRVPRQPSKLHERILEPQDVKDVINEADEGRNRTLVRLLYISGCRVSESVKLNWADLGPNRITFEGKGARTRTVMVPPSFIEELRALRWSTDENTSPVFKSVRKRRLSVQMARVIVKAAASETSDRPVTPHWFRHAHASHALDRGAPIHLVQQGLGHANVSTTSTYLHARPTDGSANYLDA